MHRCHWCYIFISYLYIYPSVQKFLFVYIQGRVVYIFFLFHLFHFFDLSACLSLTGYKTGNTVRECIQSFWQWFYCLFNFYVTLIFILKKHQPFCSHPMIYVKLFDNVSRETNLSSIHIPNYPPHKKKLLANWTELVCSSSIPVQKSLAYSTVLLNSYLSYWKK